MAILNIVKEGDETLHKVCRPVEAITPRILRLLDDMLDTLHKANGVGLAAPQVGVLRRLCIVEAEEGEVFEMINPEIIDRRGTQQEIEGCLSIPDQWGYTVRPAWVKIRAMNRRGEIYEAEGEDLLARAFCHELDHLEGKLFTDEAVRMLTEEELEAISE